LTAKGAFIHHFEIIKVAAETQKKRLFFDWRVTMHSGIDVETKVRLAAIDRLIAASLGHAAPATDAKIESWENLSGAVSDKIIRRAVETVQEQSS